MYTTVPIELPGLVTNSSRAIVIVLLIDASIRFRAAQPDGCELRQAEVQNFRCAPIHQENVSGLDVAVDDAFRVRCLQPLGDLNAHFQYFRHWQSASE